MSWSVELPKDLGEPKVCLTCGECLHEIVLDNGKCAHCYTNNIGCECDYYLEHPEECPCIRCKPEGNSSLDYCWKAGYPIDEEGRLIT